MNDVTQKVTYTQSVLLLVFIIEENKIYLYFVDPLQYEDLAHHSINIIQYNTNMAYMVSTTIHSYLLRISCYTDEKHKKIFLSKIIEQYVY